MNTPNDKQPSKSSSCDISNSQSGVEKSQKISRSPQPENEAKKLHLNYKTNTLCSDTWISLAESEASAWQQSSLGEYRQLSLWKSTPTLKQSCDRTSQESQFTQTSETTTQTQESSTLLAVDSRVQAHQTQELSKDSNIQPQHSGEKDLDVSLKPNPSSVLWNNLKDLSDGDFELFLADSAWQDTLGRLKQSRQQALVLGNRGLEYLSFPTLTSGQTSIKMRPAGQVKCEKWFKDKGLIPSGYQLGTQAIALMMGFPSNWFEDLTEQYSKNQTTQSQTKPQAESEPDISQDEQLHQDKQRSPSVESSTSTVLLGGENNSPLSTESSSSVSQKISIPCIVKQPKQPEVKGVIRKDEGDRFLVEVDGKEISVSKLFVYPDFSKSVGQIPPTKQASPPSKSSPTKTRRKKGDGTGYIYRRTVTRRGKQYQESYFRYRDESGKVRSKYIPQKLLDRVEEAESNKKPVADILVLLGGDEISRGEHSSTSDKRCVPNQDKSDELISVSRGEQVTPPSKRKRKQGEGTGYIECKPIKRSGKEYQQYWYHWEIWREGDRLTKKSRYIPKRLLAKVEKLEASKAPIVDILKVLGKVQDQ